MTSSSGHGGPRPNSGRPSLYGRPTANVTVRLPAEMIAWLDAQPDTRSQAIRRLIAAAMARQGGRQKSPPRPPKNCLTPGKTLLS